MDKIIAVFIDGIIYSSWLFTAGIGLTLIYGVMKILNLTHGSFYSLGAYMAASLTGYLLANGMEPMLSMPCCSARRCSLRWCSRH